MPIVAILLGAILIDLVARGTEREFGQQLESDFGGGSFVAWAAAIIVIGALGYVPALGKISSAAMGLVILVLVLANRGLFAQLAAVVKSPPSPAPTVALPNFLGFGSSSGSSGLGALGGGLASFLS